MALCDGGLQYVFGGPELRAMATDESTLTPVAASARFPNLLNVRCISAKYKECLLTIESSEEWMRPHQHQAPDGETWPKSSALRGCSKNPELETLAFGYKPAVGKGPEKKRNSCIFSEQSC